MRFNQSQIAAHAEEIGLEFHQCNQTHWQIKGGIAVVNLHVGHHGITMYVQGMAKGRPLRSLDDITAATIQVGRPASKARRKRSYRSVRRRKWQAAAKSGQPRCHWCHRPFQTFEETTADHVVPLSRGGSNGDDNIVLACEICNQNRADTVTEQDLRSVRKHSDDKGK